MDPVAFYHLNHFKEVQYFQEQKIGKLTYLSNYVPVRDASGKEYAYLNIPYFESQSKLQEEISNFLVTIINLNAFIFLLRVLSPCSSPIASQILSPLSVTYEGDKSWSGE